MIDHRTLTNVEGVLVCDYQNSLNAGSRGPLLVQNFHLLDLAHFNWERIPDWAVLHAKGMAAFGTFTMTNNTTRYSKAH